MTVATASLATTTATTSTAAAAPAATGQSALSWFEIPVQDLDRAERFYGALLQAPLRRQVMGPCTLAVLPYARPGTGGALFLGPSLRPADGGSLVYLSVGPDLDSATARALAAGAQLLQARVDLPEGMGSFVHVRDSEGNRVGLHALR